MVICVVYDCMVFLQAVGKKTGPAFRCIELAETPQLQLLLSPLVLAEAQDVLSRPGLRKKLKNLTDENVAEFLVRLQACAQVLPEPPKAFSLSRDPEDEPYLNLAIAGKASYLVSWNERHLNYLMRRDTPEGKDFCARFPDLKILTPPEFLSEIRQSFSQNE